MSPDALLAAFMAVVAVVTTVSALTSVPVAISAARVHRRLRATCGSGRVHSGRRWPRIDGGRLLASGPLASLGRALDRRTRRLLDRRVPESLDQVVRHLRAGSTLATALQRVGEDDPVLARVGRELGHGHTLQESVRAWRAEDDQPNRTLAATALELAASTGGASARVLDGVAASLRERIGLEREVAALSSQSRASAVVLVVAPVVFALVVAMVDHRILGVLVGRPIGWVCIGLGLGLDLLGGFWMARLIGRHR